MRTSRVVVIAALTTIVGSFIARRARVNVPGFSD